MDRSAVRDMLSEVTLKQAMSTQVLTVYEDWSIKRLAGFFIEHGISGAPVVSEYDKLLGVVTQSDVVRFESLTLTESELREMMAHYCGPFSGQLKHEDIEHLRDKASENCLISKIMTPKVVSVDVGTSLPDACEVILENHIHRLFVTDDGVLVGVITAHDMLHRLLDV